MTASKYSQSHLMEMQDHTAFPDVRSASISFVGSAVKESNRQANFCNFYQVN